MVVTPQTERSSTLFLLALPSADPNPHQHTAFHLFWARLLALLHLRALHDAFRDTWTPSFSRSCARGIRT